MTFSRCSCRRYWSVPGSAKFTASGNVAPFESLSIGSFHSRDFPQLNPPPCAVFARRVFFVFSRWNAAAWNCASRATKRAAGRSVGQGRPPVENPSLTPANFDVRHARYRERLSPCGSR
jgi:hypothetical protein